MEEKEGKKTDRRVQRTKKALRRALFELLETCDYDSITISALAREAGVDRKTFYTHYRSIDDLVDEILLEQARLIVQELGSARG